MTEGLTGVLAERILQRNIDAADQQRLIAEFLQEYRASQSN
jgi:F0F1-type ATP synthase membrane subunit b/b'